ncbi:hypothetical protein JI435_305410 [Parastagonospora nodorum SN15]|uniref:Peptidase A1 domain-containing protein n=1 Tax=Phaeosphaeria nodorum (strain SN15 / ATCC MYA-4574 / FGSC 10173) TaxID=321614 RepID=A0A7U2EWM2_PHANO|nr:hypothetical protein HBH46_068380 [Parastagonospora nodorum]QRC94307.1 hypothetical protein JI435_305410 [Parastagonospora nodorum SN15]KAH4128767.1 hypothetical protein HBH47_032870 [Parastagonospora nodorum]KAH4142333.1 hypothetical protein HBH45_053360 [Parastagonospora nodorum]KAH4156023.1 hypothetical protein HBH44_130100 [Parastagonospora nodorum]
MANILVLLAFLELALCALLKSGPNGEDGLSPNDDYMQMALHHNEIKSFSRKRQSGSPVYTKGLSSSYFVNVTFGSNNQTIPLLLDTGSPVTWVNPNCSKTSDNSTRAKAKCFGQPRYDPFDSATPKMQESSYYRANLTHIGITLPNKTHVEFDPSMWRKNKTSLPVIFDMGTPTNLLPNNLYFAIGELYPDAVPYKHRLGFTAYKVPCDAPLGTFNYTFGSCTIKVSFLASL